MDHQLGDYAPGRREDQIADAGAGKVVPTRSDIDALPIGGHNDEAATVGGCGLRTDREEATLGRDRGIA